MERPLISIIVPVYNTKKYLRKCVESILNQTYTNLEIILVDDGSKDESLTECHLLAAEDARIHVLSKENGGSSSARNMALKYVRGEYIGFIDSDDYIEPTMYEQLLQGIQQYKVKVAQIGRDEITMAGEKMPDICKPPIEPTIISDREFLKELLLHKGDCSFCTKLFKRELLQGKKFPEGVLNEDFHLLVKMLDEIGSILSLPGQSYHVFCREGSNTRKKEGFSRVFYDNIVNANMVSSMVEQKYPELSQIAFRFGIFQRIDYLLHIPIEEMTVENAQYIEIVDYMRKNWWRSMRNPILSTKNKLYHSLFAIGPRKIRMIHKRIKIKN